MNDKPECKLIDTDGNIFALLGKVRKTLKRNGMRCKVDEVTEKVTNSKSYDEALMVLSDYVKIV